MRLLQDDIKNKIKSIKCMQDLLVIYRLHKIPEYRKWCNDYWNHTYFKFQEFGDLNPDKCLYIIDDFNVTSGFFCSWYHVCLGLLVCERFGFTPVVDWTKGPYYDEEGWQGFTNPFEYFFEPVSTVSLNEIYKSKNVTFYNSHTRGERLQLYALNNEEEIARLAAANPKYIHIRPELLEQLEKEISGLLNSKKTIAVHVRGVDWGAIKGHPMPASLEAYVENIDKGLRECKFEQIFLATDSDETVAFFNERYSGKMVCYQNITRTPVGRNTLPILDESVQRTHKGFWLGYEVLKDMLTLSYCDGLVAGLSYVSFAAEVFKSGRGEKYEYKSFVEQKIQKRGKSPLALLNSKGKRTEASGK